MSTWERGRKRHGTVEIDREAALDLVEDDALDALAIGELHFELHPALLAASLLARQDSLAKRVFDALDINFDFIAGLQRCRPWPLRRIPSAGRGPRP